MHYNPKFITELKWGALLGAGLSLIKLLRYLALNIDYPFDPVCDLLMICWVIFCLYMGIKAVRDIHNDGIITFPRAFLTGGIISLFAFIFAFCYLLLHFFAIDKNAVEKKYEQTIERAKAKVNADTVTTAELQQYYQTVKQILVAEEAIIAEDSASQGMERLLEAYRHQLVERNRAADSNFYRVDSFNFRAELLLYDISRNLEGVDSTAQTAVSAANDEIHEIPTICEQRVKAMEIAPIGPLPAAAADSLSVLIYGILLDIFVALFLYRKELTKCTASTESEPETTETEEENKE